MELDTWRTNHTEAVLMQKLENSQIYLGNKSSIFVEKAVYGVTAVVTLSKL